MFWSQWVTSWESPVFLFSGAVLSMLLLTFGCIMHFDSTTFLGIRALLYTFVCYVLLSMRYFLRVSYLLTLWCRLLGIPSFSSFLSIYVVDVSITKPTCLIKRFCNQMARLAKVHVSTLKARTTRKHCTAGIASAWNLRKQWCQPRRWLQKSLEDRALRSLRVLDSFLALMQPTNMTLWPTYRWQSHMYPY